MSRRFLGVGVGLVLGLMQARGAGPEVELALELVPAREGYRFFLVVKGKESIRLAMRTSQTQRTVAMESTDTYASNRMTTGPDVVSPLCVITIFGKDGPIGRSRWQEKSLLDVRLERPAVALVLQPGDRLALHDGTYEKMPVRAEARIAVYRSGWVEHTLHWKP